MAPAPDGVHAASFRDPSGFVFSRGGRLLRQVNQRYREHYDRLMGSGLYAALVADGALVAHEDVDDEPPAEPATCYRVLAPRRLELVSYPYEWCFSQLKDAALATLAIARRALDFGMSLKDATPYNVQLEGGRPVFIDTLSFETYVEGRPWVAYRQFCELFLAPLALMSRVDPRLGLALLESHLDGVPLDLAARLLPRITRLSPGLGVHLHLHARAQRRHAGDGRPPAAEPGDRRGRFGRTAFLGLLDSLRGTVEGLRWEPRGTTWGDYYEATSYSAAAMAGKEALVGELLDAIEPRPARVWDLGANTGRFSALAVGRGLPTASLDADPAAVEKLWLAVRGREHGADWLPLLVDLADPSPGLGWANAERAPFAERAPAGCVMALALIHHLAIGRNVPLGRIAELFATLGTHAIVELVPKEDPQVRRLLASREDVFPDYDAAGFERAFAARFEVLARRPVPESPRTLWLLRRRA